MTARYEAIRAFNMKNPQKLTCRYCGDVRYYNHSCYYEDRCPHCGAVAFDCRKVECVTLADVPPDQEIRSAWA